MSPCTNWTPAARSRTRFSSDPRRCRLSSAVTRVSGKRVFNASAMLVPTKPAPPVMRTVSYMSGLHGLWLFRRVMAVVIAAGEILLKPEVEDDEQVAAAHLLDLQFGETSFAIGPAYRNHRVGVAADNRFQRHFHGKVEMRG